MTRIEELNAQLTEAKRSVLRLKDDIRYERYLERLRNGGTITARAYQFLEAGAIGESYRSQDIGAALMLEPVGQTWTVQGTLRNLCSTGVVLRVGFGRYMAVSRKPTNV